jgi:hypothetical protein
MEQVIMLSLTMSLYCNAHERRIFMKIVINTQNAVISIDDSNNDINIDILPATPTEIKPAIEIHEHQEHAIDD